MANSNSWTPHPGDTVILKLTDFSEHDGGYGRYPVLEGLNDAGEPVTVHAFHDVLKNELARLAPKLGDRILIHYKGRHPDKKYHLYKVRHADGRGAEIDWTRFGDTTAAAAPVSDIPADDAPPAWRQRGADDEDISF